MPFGSAAPGSTTASRRYAAPAHESDVGEVGTEGAALAGDDVAGRAAEILVDGGALLRVAWNAILCDLPDRSHVGDELLQLALGEPPDARHRGIRNAIRDHARQRLIVRRVVQPRTIQAGCVAAGAAGAMALDAHALEEPPAAVDVGVVLRTDSRRASRRPPPRSRPCTTIVS